MTKARKIESNLISKLRDGSDLNNGHRIVGLENSRQKPNGENPLGNPRWVGPWKRGRQLNNKLPNPLKYLYGVSVGAVSGFGVRSPQYLRRARLSSFRLALQNVKPLRVNRLTTQHICTVVANVSQLRR